jgi:hypothetical protein
MAEFHTEIEIAREIMRVAQAAADSDGDGLTIPALGVMRAPSATLQNTNWEYGGWAEPPCIPYIEEAARQVAARGWLLAEHAESSICAPIVRAEKDKLILDFPLAENAHHPFDHRRVVIDEQLIATHLGVPTPMGNHNLESFGRREADLIARAAMAQHNATSVTHLIAIDSPARVGLPDLIILRKL